MKLTFSWLKDHLETDKSLIEISQTLSSLGLVVDSIHNPGEKLDGFIVAEITDVRRHPDADRLTVCTIWTGTKSIQVVCGGVNVRPHMKVVFARSGLCVPASGMMLKETVIRGVPSSGMLCSESELGLPGDSGQGCIMDLPLDAPVGADYADYAGLNDPVLDIEITPNRGDCLGVRGVARDLAAAGMGTLKPLAVPPVAVLFETDMSIQNNLPVGMCPHFAGRLICGVKNGDSPPWMARRLAAVGIRPISALVDVTNYLCIELGRPMHVFDADRLQGGLTLRLASSGDMFCGLDEKTYTLQDQMMVIADDTGPVSLAGIMGGKSSGCTHDTTTVFLESAVFDGVSIARTGRTLGIHTDARARFERGVDGALVMPALEYAASLIAQICGGRIGSVVDISDGTAPQKTISFQLDIIEKLGGVQIPPDRAISILRDLGFDATSDGDLQYTIHVPSWRHDIQIPVDLVEEILRVYGYDAVVPLPLPAIQVSGIPTVAKSTHTRQTALLKGRRLCAERGYLEALTWSFLRHDRAVLFGGGQDLMAIDNPISKDLSHMRPCLLPHLLDAGARNAARGTHRLRLFEVGNVYDTHGDTRTQEMVIAGIFYGAAGDRHWSDSKPRLLDCYDAKADALAVLDALDVPVGAVQIYGGAPDFYHPGRSGTIRMGPKTILAAFGDIHPAILKQMDMTGPVMGFEVFVDRLPKTRGSGPLKSGILSPYQASCRDFAFFMAAETPASRLLDAVMKADRTFITDVSIFDVYQGVDGVPDGVKSIALSVRIEPKTQNLTDAEIQELSDKIIASAEKYAGATLRQEMKHSV